MMFKNKKIYSKIRESESIGLGSDRDSIGFGYTIIPNDIDRTEYIREYFKTGYCMIITEFNEIIKDVKVPLHLLQEIKFPKEVGVYGSLVTWTNQPKSNQVVLVGILQKPGESKHYEENTFTQERQIDESITITSTTDLNTRSRIVSMKNDDGDEGGMSWISKSGKLQSKLTLYNNGNVYISADNDFDVVIENQLKIQIGSEENNIGSLTIDVLGNFEYQDKDGNYIAIKEQELAVEATTIKIGDKAAEAAVLGNQLNDILTQLLSAIQKITVVCASPGSPSSPPINIAEFATISSSLTKMLSKKSKIE